MQNNPPKPPFDKGGFFILGAARAVLFTSCSSSYRKKKKKKLAFEKIGVIIGAFKGLSVAIITEIDEMSLCHGRTIIDKNKTMAKRTNV